MVDNSHTTVRIILPEASNDAVSEMLRMITREIVRIRPTEARFGLGGGDGYGCDWNSPVFEMRPFWWGDCTCGADEAEVERPHTAECAYELPNFLHHASGMKVSWYKWIGRGMEVENIPSDLEAVLSDCLADVEDQHDR